MTRDETIRVIRTIMASYPTFKPGSISDTVDVWHLMLSDIDYTAVATALKCYIRSNDSKYAPSIGELMGYINNLSNGPGLNEQEAWALVSKAMRNSTYNYLTEYSKLPEVVQQAVGTPEMLRDMATDESFNEQVASSNFMRTYRNVVDRNNQLDKLDKETERALEELAKASPAGQFREEIKARLNQPNQIVIEDKRDVAVPMPEHLKERVNRWTSA